MSASTQTATNNGKKSTNSSAVNTPASTPITSISNGQVTAQSSPPPNNNAPKYGTLVPNRIFVGGISSNTTEGELLQLFSTYGTVKAAKIIQDRAGVSKGYGFITFESEDDAKRPLREAENIVLRERKLNIAPAIKKQVSPFSRAYDASSPPAVPAGNPAQFFFPAGAMPYFQGGVYYHPPGTTNPGDPNNQQPAAVYQPPPVYPPQTGPPQAATYPSMMFPTQTIYMPQQYPMPIPYEYNYYQNNGASPHQYMHQHQQGGPGAAPPCPPMQPSNSPPRPACYGAAAAAAASQQMQGYGGPGDPMYYNVSVYGTAAAMEGTPIYSEASAFDMAPAPGPYGPEQDLYTEYDGSPGCDLSIMPLEVPPPSAPPQSLLEQQVPSTHITQVAVPPLTDTDATTTTTATTTATPSSSAAEPPTDPARNSSTPVVSLLNIEQTQEKDILSMQGGRRRKSLPNNQAPPPPMYSTNGFFQPPPSFNHNYPALFSAYNGTPMYGNHPQQHPHHHQPQEVFRYPKPMNGYDRTKKPRQNNSRYKTNESASRTSRTDSNSSASVVDETGKNEDSKFRSNVNTPPPTAYSPIANQQNYFNKLGRNYHNSYNNNNNNGRGRYRNNNQPSTGYRAPLHNKYNNNNNNNNNGGPTPTNQPQTCSSEQMVHPSGSSSSFVPPTRRSRRSIRRNQGEMGQGDGPIKPGDDAGSATATVSKKMENLKL